MIELPDQLSPSAVTYECVDPGFFQEPPLGGEVTRIDRPGARWAVELEFPPMYAAAANVLASRLRRARSEGLRVKFPLNGESQGNPGAPVVDGAVTGGTALAVRGLAAGYAAKEGYWLHVIDADGQRYLHQLDATTLADSSGDAVLTIGPPLRCALTDGATVELGAPTIEGTTPGEIKWRGLPGGLVQGFGVMLREAA